jgi:hypothetical protein
MAVCVVMGKKMIHVRIAIQNRSRAGKKGMLKGTTYLVHGDLRLSP